MKFFLQGRSVGNFTWDVPPNVARFFLECTSPEDKVQAEALKNHMEELMRQFLCALSASIFTGSPESLAKLEQHLRQFQKEELARLQARS